MDPLYFYVCSENGAKYPIFVKTDTVYSKRLYMVGFLRPPATTSFQQPAVALKFKMASNLFQQTVSVKPLLPPR